MNRATYGGASSGFTLIEMIVVIALTAVIGGMALVFMKWPVQQYLDVSRRSDLAYVAESARFRLSAEIGNAVPGSIRIAGCGAVPCIEFLPAKQSGRYRALPAPGASDTLDFNAADDSFDIIGPPLRFAAGDYLVLGPGAYDAGASGSLRAYAGADGLQRNVAIAPLALPEKSQGQRFFVVDGGQQAVTYACVGRLGALNADGDGQAQLVRRWAYGFNPVPRAPSGGLGAMLADRVSDCAFDAAGDRLVGVRLTLTAGGERVRLHLEIPTEPML